MAIASLLLHPLFGFKTLYSFKQRQEDHRTIEFLGHFLESRTQMMTPMLIL